MAPTTSTRCDSLAAKAADPRSSPSRSSTVRRAQQLNLTSSHLHRPLHPGHSHGPAVRPQPHDRGRRIGSSTTLDLLTRQIWSIAASCQAAVTNPAGVYVCRLFVGIGEAFFGQAMVFYLSLWYPRTVRPRRCPAWAGSLEQYLAKRVGIFISAGAVAGAFGGLIAFGVAKIQNSSIAQWCVPGVEVSLTRIRRILFLIEGLPSAFLAMCVSSEWRRS